MQTRRLQLGARLAGWASAQHGGHHRTAPCLRTPQSSRTATTATGRQSALTKADRWTASRGFGQSVARSEAIGGVEPIGDRTGARTRRSARTVPGALCRPSVGPSGTQRDALCPALRCSQHTGRSRPRFHESDKDGLEDEGLATCIANPLISMAPRPGLEPGTYGLTDPPPIDPQTPANARFAPDRCLIISSDSS